MNAGGISVRGIGIIGAPGTGVDAVWRSLNGGGTPETDGVVFREKELPFTVDLPASKLRRVNRYSRLALAASLEAQKDAGLTIDAAAPFRYGVVFTTGYGSLVSNIGFTKAAARDEPDLCSPTLFAGTVANACVGQVCMQLNLKGPGTVLTGGNAFLYSKLLIETGGADVMFAGAVEEYCADLFDALGKNEISAGVQLSEGAAAFILERADEGSCCLIGESVSVGLEAWPLIGKFDPPGAEDAVKHAIRRCIERGGKADVVVGSANGSWFDGVEARAFAEELPDAFVLPGVKDCFGETLGSAFSMNVAVAAMCLRYGALPSVPARGASYDGPLRKILVTGCDPIGNYHCMELKSSKK
ncbi:MAG: hypothetical protein LBQ90_13245 [Synergistaceae bacterium]|jgi:3-oxoacyl-[acyl-carrier-protein] synthase II|nr:hypothetical protein [Synergistaceae bacterium]